MLTLVEIFKTGFALSIPIALVGAVIYVKKDKMKDTKILREKIKDEQIKQERNAKVPRSTNSTGRRWWQFWKGREGKNPTPNSKGTETTERNGTEDSTATTNVEQQRDIPIEQVGSTDKPKQYFS